MISNITYTKLKEALCDKSSLLSIAEKFRLSKNDKPPSFSTTLNIDENVPYLPYTKVMQFERYIRYPINFYDYKIYPKYFMVDRKILKYIKKISLDVNANEIERIYGNHLGCVSSIFARNFKIYEGISQNNPDYFVFPFYSFLFNDIAVGDLRIIIDFENIDDITRNLNLNMKIITNNEISHNSVENRYFFSLLVKDGYKHSNISTNGKWFECKSTVRFHTPLIVFVSQYEITSVLIVMKNINLSLPSPETLIIDDKYYSLVYLEQHLENEETINFNQIDGNFVIEFKDDQIPEFIEYFYLGQNILVNLINNNNIGTYLQFT